MTDKEWIRQKLTSRKFWLGVAGFLSGAGTSIVGAFTDNPELMKIGTIVSCLSVGIYSALETTVDVTRLKYDTSADKEDSDNA